MTQGFVDNCYGRGHNAASDLQNMENNFAALRSSFSGSGSPSNPVAFQLWGDSTKEVLKCRDRLNANWLGLMHADASQKTWVYRDSAMDGWSVDSSVTDKVLAVKGGTTYTAGAATAGSWTCSGYDHIHQWYESNQPGGNDKVWDSGGVKVNIDSLVGYSYAYGVFGYNYVPGSSELALQSCYTEEATFSDEWRLAAATGTLQYMDL